MKYIRWYDKTPDLSEVFEFIQKLEKPVQEKIGQDILQVLINDFRLDLDKEINRISKNYTYECKRWYDGNIDLFSSFEIIKNLPDNLKNKVVKKLVESLWFIHIESGKSE